MWLYVWEEEEEGEGEEEEEGEEGTGNPEHAISLEEVAEREIVVQVAASRVSTQY